MFLFCLIKVLITSTAVLAFPSGWKLRIWPIFTLDGEHCEEVGTECCFVQNRKVAHDYERKVLISPGMLALKEIVGLFLPMKIQVYISYLVWLSPWEVL